MDIVRFIKDWTLPISIFTGSVIYLIFAYVPWLDPVSVFMAPKLDLFLPLCTFGVLYVTFCKVDFHALRPVKWHLRILLVQFALVTVLVVIAFAFPLSWHARLLVEGMLACVISPGATAAPVVTQKLGGNLEEMTSFTFLSNILSALLIPISFSVITESRDVSFLQGFLKISGEVALVLLLPMVCAYFTKHFLSGWHRRIVGVKDLAYYLWCANLLLVSGTTVRNILHAQTSGLFLLLMAVAVLLLCLVLFSMGRSIGKPLQAPVNAGQALGQKNTVFAIWVANTYLNPLSSVGPGCYILWQNIINSVEIWSQTKKRKN